MISILIPVYNYDVVSLVNALHNQAAQLNVTIEIRVIDDYSTNQDIVCNNSEIDKLDQVFYQRFEENMGRTATRNHLAAQARYDWLLFLDADMWPGSADFLKIYAENLQEHELVFGGIQYEPHKPAGKELRWKYGTFREAQNVNRRKKNPYLSVLSAVMLIKKDCFLKANDFLENRYGLDVLFTANLKKMAIKVLHIDNPAYHLGLEDNGVFMEKSKIAMQSIAYFDKNGQIPEDHRGIQKMAKKLEKSDILRHLLKFILRFKPQIMANLHSANPSLVVFDIFRLHILIENNAPDA